MTSNFSMLSGIFLGVSIDYEPYAGKIIVSRKKLGLEEVAKILGDMDYILSPRDTIIDRSMGV